MCSRDALTCNAAVIAHGHKVIGTVRRTEQFAALQQLGAVALQLDVTSSVEELKAFASSAISQYGRVDVLINNAGLMMGGAVEETS